jgi:hypothetical protein
MNEMLEMVVRWSLCQTVKGVNWRVEKALLVSKINCYYNTISQEIKSSESFIKTLKLKIRSGFGEPVHKIEKALGEKYRSKETGAEVQLQSYMKKIRDDSNRYYKMLIAELVNDDSGNTITLQNNDLLYVFATWCDEHSFHNSYSQYVLWNFVNSVFKDEVIPNAASFVTRSCTYVPHMNSTAAVHLYGVIGNHLSGRTIIDSNSVHFLKIVKCCQFQLVEWYEAPFMKFNSLADVKHDLITQLATIQPSLSRVHQISLTVIILKHLVETQNFSRMALYVEKITKQCNRWISSDDLGVHSCTLTPSQLTQLSECLKNWCTAHRELNNNTPTMIHYTSSRHKSGAVIDLTESKESMISKHFWNVNNVELLHNPTNNGKERLAEVLIQEIAYHTNHQQATTSTLQSIVEAAATYANVERVVMDDVVNDAAPATTEADVDDEEDDDNSDDDLMSDDEDNSLLDEIGPWDIGQIIENDFGDNRNVENDCKFMEVDDNNCRFVDEEDWDVNRVVDSSHSGDCFVDEANVTIDFNFVDQLNR